MHQHVHSQKDSCGLAAIWSKKTTFRIKAASKKHSTVVKTRFENANSSHHKDPEAPTCWDFHSAPCHSVTQSLRITPATTLVSLQLRATHTPPRRCTLYCFHWTHWIPALHCFTPTWQGREVHLLVRLHYLCSQNHLLYDIADIFCLHYYLCSDISDILCSHNYSRPDISDQSNWASVRIPPPPLPPALDSMDPFATTLLSLFFYVPLGGMLAGSGERGFLTLQMVSSCCSRFEY